MHRVLEEQVRQALNEADGERIDLARLLAIVDAHYDKLDERGSGPTELQIAFDSVADAVIAIDKEGIVTYSNLAAAQVFGFETPRIERVPLARLLPDFAGATADETLRSCLTDVGDTSYKIQTAEFDGVRADGRRFTAEVNASVVEGSARNAYVLCLRDITASRLSRAHLEESEERYRALVEHAPEAILVLDVDTNQFVDVNDNATRLFNMSRKRLLKIGPEGISPKYQLDGKPSFGHSRGFIQRALDGERPVFEWLHLDADGKELPCEVRFIRLPSATRRLIRASVTSIAERKRQELLTYGENRILEMIANQTELGSTLKAVCRTIGQVIAGARAAVLMPGDGDTLKLAAGPSLPPDLRSLLSDLSMARLGVPAVEVIRTRQRMLVNNCAQQSSDDALVACLSKHRLNSIWAFPALVADGEVGAALCIFLDRSSQPGTDDLDAVANLIRLAEIAVKRDGDEKALRASEQRFRGLFENVVDGVYISTAAGRITAANPALVTMLGYDSMEQLTAEGSTEELYINQQDFRRFIETLHRDHVVKNFEVRLRRRDGRQIVVLENARAVRDDAGVIVAHEGTITDITDRKHAETRVFEEKERAQVTLNSIGDGVITTDAEGRVDYLNPVAADLTGWEPRAARGRPVDQIFTVVATANREMLDNPVLRCLREGRVITLPESSALVDRNGKAIEIQDSTAPIRDRIGNVIGAVMVFHELNKASRLSRQLSYQAAHDSLTGLINRREFENQLSQKIEEAGRDPQLAHALLLIDVDQFQVLNDSLGHTAGDEYLRQLADVVQGEIRVTDILARLGGDEFAILLQNCSLDRANQVAEAIRGAIERFVFHWQERVHTSRASIGIVVIDHDIRDTGTAFSAADVACFAAKDAG
ncbi:MAG: PAS domain S-box protein, partial [Pseudomonadota bacterium]